jgi:flavin-dependent dehydrogenase
MPVRETLRGGARTPLDDEADVLVCGASFAGLAVARELRACGADVLVVDRYEIGERQTSACAAPTAWLVNLGLEEAILQTFDEIVVHTARATVRWPVPYTFSTFDYRVCCEALWAQCGAARFEIAKIEGRGAAGAGPIGVAADRGILRAPLVVDALGWRRVLGRGVQPPEAPLSRGLEVHPSGSGDAMELWIDRAVVPAGYGWSFPAASEVRVGIGSYDPRHHVKQDTLDLVEHTRREPVGYQGNWIPHALRPGTEEGIFFAGDSAGHCIPTSAEGIRTAWYFAIACGRELREVLAGRRDRAEALRRYDAFTAAHAWKFDAMLRLQWLVPRMPPPVLGAIVAASGRQPLGDFLWEHYLRIAPPDFALPAPASAPASAASDPGAAAA